MNLWLVKFGMIFVILRQEGIFRGMITISNAGYGSLKKIIMPLRGDVLLISAGYGDSGRYRTEYVAEELSLHGINATATMQSHPFLMRAVDRFSVFVLHRTFYDENLERFVEKVKKQKKTIIFETDDLIFDSRFINHVEVISDVTSIEKEAFARCTGEKIVQDEYVKNATTTTKFLAEKIKEKDKKVFIVPNKLSQNDLKVAEKIYEEKCKKLLNKDEYIRIGYFSGSKSHDKDFETIIEAMRVVLGKNQNVLLYVVGHIVIDDEFVNSYKEQIKILPFVLREKHFENIASVDINIVPLEDNPFCDAKSEIKFLEAGIMRVPTIAVKNPTFSAAITHGKNGFLARSKSEWIKSLQELIDDEPLRERVGKNAYKTVLTKYTTDATNKEYIDFLKKNC